MTTTDVDAMTSDVWTLTSTQAGGVEWTTTSSGDEEEEGLSLSDAVPIVVVCVASAVILSIMLALIIYNCCCRKKKYEEERYSTMVRQSYIDAYNMQAPTYLMGGSTTLATSHQRPAPAPRHQYDLAHTFPRHTQKQDATRGREVRGSSTASIPRPQTYVKDDSPMVRADDHHLTSDDMYDDVIAGDVLGHANTGYSQDQDGLHKGRLPLTRGRVETSENSASKLPYYV